MMMEDTKEDNYEELETDTDIDTDIDVQEMNSIRDTIESMSKFNQVEVLRILSLDESVLNENKYGVHVNLSDLKNTTLEKLKNYINYVNAQELNFNTVEKQKESFKNTYFGKDNKDINTKSFKDKRIKG